VPRRLSPIPARAVSRGGVALATGLAAYWIARGRMADSAPLLVGWNAAGLALLVVSWILIGDCDAHATRDRAGSEDPGRTLVYVIVVLTSAVSLFAATVLVRGARSIPADAKQAVILLCLATVGLAWAMTHTAFTFRYAHLYYREDAEGIGGLTLPGDERPSYFDFAYFAFTIGMCFQVSDVCITSHQIRRTVLLHAIISFVYNTAILAFVLNLVFGIEA
jgi:uncharacterized membrane protein